MNKDLKRKIKVIIGLIWFVLSILASIISCAIYQEALVLCMISMFLSFGWLVSDPETTYMNLW